MDVSERPGLRLAGTLWPVLLAWLGGTALQLFQPALWSSSIYAGLLPGSLVLLAVSRRLRGAGHVASRTALALAAVATLAFAQVGWRAALFQAQALEAGLEGRDLLVTGVIRAMPQRQAEGLRLQFEVETASADAVQVRVPPRIQLGWYRSAGGDEGEPLQQGGLPALWAGERWRLPVRLKAPHGNSNPHGFDYELWLWVNGVQATGYVREGGNRPAPVRIGQTGHQPVEWLRQATRARIEARLGPQPQAGWITALVTGDQNAIEQADWDLFRATGVAHLMSISGLHITMFAWVAAGLVGAAWRRSEKLCLWLAAPQAALLGGLVLAWAYALFSGWGVPSRRTIGMLAVVSLLRLSGKGWPWPMVWLLVAALVLALDPWAMLQPGFWLSFVAVGVLFAAGPAQAGERAGRWRQAWRNMLREQAVITLALTPLVVVLFGQVSLVGFIANLCAIPWVTLLVTPLALAGVALPALWDLAAWAVGLLAWLLRALAWPEFASVPVAAAPHWVASAGIVGGLLLALRLPLLLRLAGASLLLPLLLWQPPRPAVGQFDLLAADVGQGNAVLLRTAAHALLYDAGPRYARDSDAGHRVLLPLLRALGVTPDLLVLSHRDSDHVGGAAAVLAMAPAAGLLTSIEPAHALHGQRPGVRCQAGQSWTWDGVTFSVIHPHAEDYGGRARPNHLSCVLRVQAAAGVRRADDQADDQAGGQGSDPADDQGRDQAVERAGGWGSDSADGAGVAQRGASTRRSGPAVVLLAGDIESAQERRLVRSGVALGADVLLVPHHGSTSSSSAEFLDAVAPRVALVQSGYRNRFGHPAPAPLARYAERSIAVLVSPRCGAMLWRSDEPGSVRCQRSIQRHYWQHQP